MTRINKDNVDRFFDYHFFLDSRTLYLGGDIDDHSAEYLIKGLHVLERISTELPITIIFCSHGGEEESGYAIYDSIKNSSCEIIGEVRGHASSMASIILQACDRRVAMANSQVLIHDGDMEVEGGAISIENEGKYSKASRWKMYRIYEARSGKSAKYWDKKCKSDYVMTAKEALKEGLIDEVLE